MKQDYTYINGVPLCNDTEAKVSHKLPVRRLYVF